MTFKFMLGICVKIIVMLVAIVVQEIDANGAMIAPISLGALAGDVDIYSPQEESTVCRANVSHVNSVAQATLWAGENVTVQMNFTERHDGDCAAYLTYDTDKLLSKMKWFKIGNLVQCNRVNSMIVTIPNGAPACDRALLRWEWNLLDDTRVTGYYANCALVEVHNSEVTQNCILPSSVETYTIPGHLSDRTAFRSIDDENPQEVALPPVVSNILLSSPRQRAQVINDDSNMKQFDGNDKSYLNGFKTALIVLALLGVCICCCTYRVCNRGRNMATSKTPRGMFPASPMSGATAATQNNPNIFVLPPVRSATSSKWLASTSMPLAKQTSHNHELTSSDYSNEHHNRIGSSEESLDHSYVSAASIYSHRSSTAPSRTTDYSWVL